MRTAKYGAKAKAPPGVYQRPRPPSGAGEVLHPPAPRANPNPDALPPGPYYVQGRRASDLEYLTYRALRRLGWRDGQIQFQVDFLGGRLPGGVVLDFVVWTYGGPVIVEPNGDYWHTSSVQLIERDRQRSAAIAAAWNRPFQYHILTKVDFVDANVTYRKLMGFVGRG